MTHCNDFRTINNLFNSTDYTSCWQSIHLIGIINFIDFADHINLRKSVTRDGRPRVHWRRAQELVYLFQGWSKVSIIVVRERCIYTFDVAYCIARKYLL
jgi:hypothetical protein